MNRIIHRTTVITATTAMPSRLADTMEEISSSAEFITMVTMVAITSVTTSTVEASMGEVFTEEVFVAASMAGGGTATVDLWQGG